MTDLWPGLTPGSFSDDTFIVPSVRDTAFVPAPPDYVYVPGPHSPAPRAPLGE